MQIHPDPKKRITEGDEGIFNDMPPEDEERQNEWEREEHRAEADLEDKQPAGDTGPEDVEEKAEKEEKGESNY